MQILFLKTIIDKRIMLISLKVLYVSQCFVEGISNHVNKMRNLPCRDSLWFIWCILVMA